MSIPPIQPKSPNLGQRFLLLITKIFPERGPLGLINLLARRPLLQQLNLYPAALENVSADEVPDYRTPDGAGNDPKHYKTGASDTAFGRNMPPETKPNPLRDPPVQVVAAELLARTSFKPAGDQLNILAAAWIQAMAHDWFGHYDSDEDVELKNGSSQCPLQSFRFKRTKQRPDGAFDNFRTHWWDASFVYGQNEEAVTRSRTGSNGLLHVSEKLGVLPKADDGTNLVGDSRNGWAGVSLLQELFLREHNAVAAAIAEAHPELRGDDEALFRKARLVIAALVAKIHTVDWTIELLKTKLLDVAMTTNWYGIPRALGLAKNNPPGFLGLVGQKKSENHGVPYCLTEEFVSVYRLHPLMPDGIPLSSGFAPLSSVVGLEGDKILEKEDLPQDFWNSMIRYPCGNLELFNYPKPLRDIAPTDDYGRAKPDHVDLAALDLYRDRERGILNYNEFRRQLNMKPFKNYEDLCGGKTEQSEALLKVYGADGIENVDLLVGLLAEKKIPGFAISETAFFIFIVMATRRLEADRFFTTDFNEKTYTKTGLKWVHNVQSMRDVLKRHFPDIEARIPKDTSAFKPRDLWPQ